VRDVDDAVHDERDAAGEPLELLHVVEVQLRQRRFGPLCRAVKDV